MKQQQEKIDCMTNMKKGERGTVVALPKEKSLRHRLMDLGLTMHSQVECVGTGPFPFPIAYHCKGTLLALRKQDTDRVQVKTLRPLRVAFAGNPNVGKSTLFNQLTGLTQHTGNWAGKTVELAVGNYVYQGRQYELIDLPGCYSLSQEQGEESIAGEYLKSGMADLVVVVCDATCLERNLSLVLQILEITSSVIVCVNLMDEAAKKRIYLDLEELETLLGVPVIGLVARKKREKEKLLRLLHSLTAPAQEEPAVDREFSDQASQIGAQVITRERQFHESSWDRLFLGKYTAIPCMVLFLTGIFWLTLKGANIPSQWLSDLLFGIQDWLEEGCKALSIPRLLYEPFLFGMYRVLAWVVSVMLPPMAIFFPLFTLLEDAGYLPRIAFHMDGCFAKCKACGKQALTMCMGIGCNAVGVTGCRIIDTKRERLLAILTNSFMPCNGRFPMLAVFAALFFAPGASPLALAGLVFLGVGMTFLVSWLLSITLLKGVPSSVTLELPSYRSPQLGKVLIRSVLDRTLFVLGRAVLVAAPAGLLIWFLANCQIGDKSVLFYCTDFLEPMGTWLGMDGVILTAFLLGLPANEIVLPLMVMMYLSQGNLQEMEQVGEMGLLLGERGWTFRTALCCMLFSLFHWPCSTTILTIYKETKSLRWTALGILLPLLIGIMLCRVVAIVF